MTLPENKTLAVGRRTPFLSSLRRSLLPTLIVCGAVSKYVICAVSERGQVRVVMLVDVHDADSFSFCYDVQVGMSVEVH